VIKVKQDRLYEREREGQADRKSLDGLTNGKKRDKKKKEGKKSALISTSADFI
jgi:hypothetical protein